MHYLFIEYNGSKHAECKWQLFFKEIETRAEKKDKTDMIEKKKI